MNEAAHAQTLSAAKAMPRVISTLLSKAKNVFEQPAAIYLTFRAKSANYISFSLM